MLIEFIFHEIGLNRLQNITRKSTNINTIPPININPKYEKHDEK
jgi:hypothetical protein